MTRGNQRDINRERAGKRNANAAPKGKLPDKEKRQNRDADIMRQKQQQAAEKKSSQNSKEKKTPVTTFTNQNKVD